MAKLGRILISSALVGLLIVGAFFIGSYHGQESVICEVCPPQDLNFSLFWETYNKLKENYVNPEEITEQDIVYGAIKGMVAAIGDPYTIFLDPEESKDFRQEISGSFEGVGMEVGMKEDKIQVIAPLKGTPAEKAGIRAGDVILAIDGKSTTGMVLDEAVGLIRGPKGTIVALTIERDGRDESIEIEITRGVIDIPSIKWELLDNDIVYIELYNFNENAGLDFAQEAINILASRGNRIILDLRNNPGGYLHIAQEIAGFWLKRGEVVVMEEMGERQIEYKARGVPVFEDYPTVVLINRGSASASEILAGALKDGLGIKLIGEDSFGKGSVQQLESLSNGSSLKVTTARWLTPNGTTISEIGLKPDIFIEKTQEDYEQEKDPQLEKAKEILLSE